MTTWANKTIIVPAYLVNAARNIGACLDSAGAGMYTAALSPNGKAPATHFCSSGCMSAAFMHLLEDGELLFAAAQAGAQAQGLTLTATQGEADALVARSIVSDLPPFDVFAEQGLQLVEEGRPDLAGA